MGGQTPPREQRDAAHTHVHTQHTCTQHSTQHVDVHTAHTERHVCANTAIYTCAHAAHSARTTAHRRHTRAHTLMPAHPRSHTSRSTAGDRSSEPLHKSGVCFPSCLESMPPVGKGSAQGTPPDTPSRTAAVALVTPPAQGRGAGSPPPGAPVTSTGSCLAAARAPWKEGGGGPRMTWRFPPELGSTRSLPGDQPAAPADARQSSGDKRSRPPPGRRGPGEEQ